MNIDKATRATSAHSHVSAVPGSHCQGSASRSEAISLAHWQTAKDTQGRQPQGRYAVEPLAHHPFTARTFHREPIADSMAERHNMCTMHLECLAMYNPSRTCSISYISTSPSTPFHSDRPSPPYVPQNALTRLETSSSWFRKNRAKPISLVPTLHGLFLSISFIHSHALSCPPDPISL